MSFFCSRVARSKKSIPSDQHQPNKTSSDNSNVGTTKTTSSNISNTIDTNQIVSKQNNTTVPIRYITTEFNAERSDEISVKPNDIVYYVCSDGEWAQVFSPKLGKSGFVPGSFLSLEPTPEIRKKKKIPRSLNEESSGSPTMTKVHRHYPQITGQFSSNSENIHLPVHQHPIEYHQRSGMSHSLQGSSGNHSLQKHMDLVTCQPTCHNDCFFKYELFKRDFLGICVVLYNFVAREEHDLEVTPGDQVRLLNRDDEDWYWVQREDRKEGFVPAKFLCHQDQVRSYLNKGNSTVTCRSSNQIEYPLYINTGPIDPAVMPKSEKALIS